MHVLTYWRGLWRLWWQLCPACDSSPPRPTCPICEGSYEYGHKAKDDDLIVWRSRWELARR